MSVEKFIGIIKQVQLRCMSYKANPTVVPAGERAGVLGRDLGL